MARFTIVDRHTKLGGKTTVREHVRRLKLGKKGLTSDKQFLSKKGSKGNSVNGKKPSKKKPDNKAFYEEINKKRKEGIIPNEWTNEDVLNLSGISSDDEISNFFISGSKGLPRLSIETSKLKVERSFDIEEGEVLNELFVAKKEYRGTGLGTKTLKLQAESAQNKGFSKLVTYGAASIGDDPANGYYTWPRLGYETSNKKGLAEYKSYISDPEIKNAKSFSELMSTKKGRDYWKSDGRYVPIDSVYEMEFDLNKNSDSFKRLNDYIAEKSG